MTPETFALAIIAAIGTTVTGIIVGAVSLFVARKSAAESASAKTEAQAAKTEAQAATTTVAASTEGVAQKTDEALSMIKGLSDQLSKALERENGDLKTQLRMQGEQLSNQGKQLTALLETQNQTVKDTAVVREENIGLRLDIDNYKQSLSEVQEDNKSIRAELTAQQTYSRRLEESLSKAKESYEQTISSTADQLNSAKSELDRVIQENTALKEQVKEIDSLRQRVAKLEKEMETMLQERDLLIKQIDALKAERDEARTQLQAALDEKTALIAERDELKQKVAELSADKGAAQAANGVVPSEPETK